ncbi:TPA: hypothetical protein ACXYLJ_002952 [Legionella pneumophila]
MSCSWYKLIILGLLYSFTLDAYAVDVFAGLQSSIFEVIWEKKLYIPFGLIAVIAYLRSRA